MSFSSHSVRPEAVLTLAKELFGGEPKGYILGIRGYEFDEFGQRLSDAARANLASAIEYVESALRAGKESGTGPFFEATKGDRSQENNLQQA